MLINILLGQQTLLHATLRHKVLEPEWFLPPHNGLGLLYRLTRLSVPPPHVLLHGPYSQLLQLPSTIQLTIHKLLQYTW